MAHDPRILVRQRDSRDEPDPVSDQASANAMNGLDRLLIGRFRRHETHRRPADRFADGFRIIPVILLDFTYGVTN